MLRIAFDLDGTLADLDSALDAVAEELFPRAIAASRGESERQPETASAGQPQTTPAAGETAAPDDEAEAVSPEEEQLAPPEVRALTRRQQHDIWAGVRDTSNFWETLSETEPAIVSRIAAIAADRRWEVIFITQRPPSEGDTTQRQSQRWLARHGFEMPSVYVLGPGASRGKVATALSLDVVVDDRTENCLDVKVDSTARAFLVCRTPTPHVAENAARLGIEVVRSVGECLDRLTAPAAAKPGFVKRLKAALGVHILP